MSAVYVLRRTPSCGRLHSCPASYRPRVATLSPLEQEQMLAGHAFFLLAVSNAVGASEKDTSNTAEGHWVSARTPTTKHWLHPYLVGDAPLERSRGQNVGINRYNIVLR